MIVVVIIFLFFSCMMLWAKSLYIFIKKKGLGIDGEGDVQKLKLGRLSPFPFRS
jgi:hypothetical protein